MWVTVQCLASAHVISLESAVEFTNRERFSPGAVPAPQPAAARGKGELQLQPFLLFFFFPA